MEARKRPHEIPPVQRSVIDNQLFTPKAPMWIFPFLFSFGENADVDRILDAARKVTQNHLPRLCCCGRCAASRASTSPT